MPTVAQTLVDTLKKLGVETVFGLPGGEVVEVFNSHSYWKLFGRLGEIEIWS